MFNWFSPFLIICRRRQFWAGFLLEENLNLLKINFIEKPRIQIPNLDRPVD